MENANVVDVAVRDEGTIMVEIKTTISNVNLTALSGAISIGEKLKEIKELMPHGAWLPYVKENLDWSERKVQQFIQISENYGVEGSAYSELLKSANACADLSFSNALKLLTIPEDEVREFAEDHIEDGMKSKDFEDQIKKYKEENEDLGQELITLREELKAAKEDNTAADELQKIERKLEKVEKKLEKAEEEKESAVQAAKVQATEEAVKEAKTSSAGEIAKLSGDNKRLKEQLLAAENRAVNSGDPILITFKNRTDDLQMAFREMTKCIYEVEGNDEIKAGNMRNAVSTLLAGMEDQLQGVIK